MALWRAYQQALASHPWKVQVLTAEPTDVFSCTTKGRRSPLQAGVFLGGLAQSSDHRRGSRRVPDGRGRCHLTAAGGEEGSAGPPTLPDGHHGFAGLWLCGSRGGWLVPGLGRPRPGKYQGDRIEEDVGGSGGLCPMFPGLLLASGRCTQWPLGPRQLGQAAAGLYGRPHHQLLYLACCAVSQLLFHPPPLQIGRRPVRGCHLELLPVLEGAPALSGRPASPSQEPQAPVLSPPGRQDLK
ncbi:protein Mpv17 isoform X2 [Tachyglossus aculeatus]|uniref:protein Mpv17 isoform X2 n=1 Tax=Tachyglossus aculeatus TaxID=9261 RepID=UPI0018F303A3|nr:protein Mpv17 isoform X2 [Tachyglossus aculeatus]XP_038607174.1 protein Mpv17 isoform X2 [Tachyglossus aculeatus]